MYSSYTLTYAAPDWSNASSYNYRRLQISQSKCLRVIGNFPRCTPIPRLHTTLNVTPIRDFIHHLTANFLDRCPAHPNPLDHSIGSYSLADLHHQYKKYIHKRPKHILFYPFSSHHRVTFWQIWLPHSSHACTASISLSVAAVFFFSLFILFTES